MIVQKYFPVFLKMVHRENFIKYAWILCMFFLNVANASEKQEFVALQILEHPPIIGTTLRIRQIMCKNLLMHNVLPQDIHSKKVNLDTQLSQLINGEKTYLEAQQMRREQFDRWLNAYCFDPLNENNERIGRNHIIGISFLKTFPERALTTYLLNMIVGCSWQVQKETDYLDRALDNFKCLLPFHLKSKQDNFQREFQNHLAAYLKEGSLYYTNYLLAFKDFQRTYNSYFYPSLFSQFQHYIRQKKDKVQSSLLGNASPHAGQDNQDEEKMSGVFLPAKL